MTIREFTRAIKKMDTHAFVCLVVGLYLSPLGLLTGTAALVIRSWERMRKKG